MLYINNEQVKKLPNDLSGKREKDLYEEFKSIYKGNLDDVGRIHPNRPIIIKYKPSLIQEDPDNPGRKRFPQSYSLSYVAYTERDGVGVEVRYSPVAVRMTKDGPDYKFNSADVIRGIMPVTDFDLAFFFYAFSKQNYERYPNEPHAAFVIENVEAERQIKVMANQKKAVLMARLWNEPEEGGVSETILRVAAAGIGIRDADTKSINNLREEIDVMITDDPTRSVIKEQFLLLTDTKKSIDEMKMDAKFSANKAIIVEAIARNIIQVHNPSSTWYWSKADGKSGDKIYCFADMRRTGDKTPSVDLLLLYIEGNAPEILTTLRDRVDTQKLVEV